LPLPPRLAVIAAELAESAAEPILAPFLDAENVLAIWDGLDRRGSAP